MFAMSSKDRKKCKRNFNLLHVRITILDQLKELSINYSCYQSTFVDQILFNSSKPRFVSPNCSIEKRPVFRPFGFNCHSQRNIPVMLCETTDIVVSPQCRNFC